MKDRLTIEDVMKDLEVGRNTAYKIFKRADFPAILLGRKFSVSREPYEVWKKQRREKEREE